MAITTKKVTILTGFLGSGKTTLLNAIIKQNPDTKFAIIENEFGEINIDADLIVKANENIFELSNGCICCSLNGELADMLNKLITGPYEFDHLIIETTGIADPAGVAAVFMTDYNIQSVFKLDSTVCLVDCNQVLDVLGVEEEASQQLAFADYLIYNKAGDLSDDEKGQLKARIATINPFAQGVFCEFAETDTRLLLDIKAYEKQKLPFKFSIGTSPESLFKPIETKHNNIVSQSFIIKESFDLLKLRHYFTVMLFIQGSFFYRIKGVLYIEGISKKLILQSVKGAPVFTDGDEWHEDEEKESRIVFIGKNLRRDILEKGLKQCYFKS